MSLGLVAALLGALTIFVVLGLLTGQLSRTRRQVMARALRVEARRVMEDAVESGDTARVELLREDAISANPHLSRVLRRFSWSERRAVTLEQGALPLKVSEYAFILGAGFLVAGVAAAWLSGIPPAGLLAGAGAVLVGEWYVTRRAKQRINRFNEQLPAALQMMAVSLQSGFGIMDAIRTVGQDMEPPLSEEFSRILDETRAGGSFDESLERLTERIGTPDLRIVAQALTVHRSVGGDLGQILGQVAQTMREREKLRRDIISMTTQERMSATIVAMLPLWCVGLFLVIQPELIQPLWQDRTGQIMAGAAILLEVLGFILMRKVTTVEV